MRIMFDISNVLADFDKRITEELMRLYPELSIVSINNRKTAILSDDYPEFVKPLILAIYNRPGFYLTIPPIPGSLEAIASLDAMGIDVWFAGKPFQNYKNRIEQKYAWIEKYFGSRFVEKIILCEDKTLLRADILVDDKPEILGREIPTWEHVLYSQPYNANVTNKRRMTWDNWKEVLLEPQ